MNATMVRLLFTCFLLAVCILFACDTNQVESVQLELVYLPELRVSPPTEGPATLAASALSAAGDRIDLGDVRATRDFYFLLRNRGTAAVNDVRVELFGAGEEFSVTPSLIEEVTPFGSTTVEEALASGLIRLTVEHGISSEGDGSYTPPLSLGPHSVELRADALGQGTAATHHSVHVTLDILARVTDISVYDATGEVDLFDSGGSILTGGFEAGTFVPMYNVSGDVRVVNTGNVDVIVERFYDWRIPEPFLLAPGDEIEVVAGADAYIAIAEGEAVRDVRKLPLLANGKTYIYLRP